jgi:non-reducing end alpha-L-arabinofuranosidase
VLNRTELLGTSPQFAQMWQEQEVATRKPIVKRVAAGAIGPSFIHGGLMTSFLRIALAAAVTATVLTGTFASVAANAGTNGRVGTAGRMLPCDIYAAAHTPCVAAYSTVRALYASYDGSLYQVQRASDQAVSNIGLLRPGGAADAAAQEAFCVGTSCTITMIYDQSGHKNDLAIEDHDKAASATALPVTIGGHTVYGVYIRPGMGYRHPAPSTGVAVGDEPEGIYMVTGGVHVNRGCCFDFGNVEAKIHDDGAGHMDAVNFSTKCYFGSCTGDGPWVQADLENGLFQSDKGTDKLNKGNASTFVTALVKNNGRTVFTLKGGNARRGSLTTWYSGPLPTRYSPMQKEGSIVLGTGGDGTNLSRGYFFEGVLTAGYPPGAADRAVQANIVTAGYLS